MIKYIIKRILLMIPVLLGVIIVVFSINFLSPVDPINQLVSPDAPIEVKEAKRAELGLDKPYIVQLYNYVKGIVTKLDLGTSYTTKSPVLGEILYRFPTTFLLAVLAVALATIIGIPLGVLAATKRNSVLDYIATFLALIGASVPSFWLGLMMIVVFALNLGWLPPSGLDTPLHWIMPVIAISVFSIATIMRTTRSSMLEVIRQDYIRTARSKGIAEKKVIFRHALKNALIPVITIVGMQLAFVMGGVIVLEAVFQIPGLGSYLKTAIATNDYPAIRGAVLFTAFVMSVANLLVDVIYAFIDPRIKSQYVRKKSRTSGPKDDGPEDDGPKAVEANAEGGVA